MEGSSKRFSPRMLMALALAMTAAQSPIPMEDNRRQRRHEARTHRFEPRAPRSKYKSHQGSKECARRLRQMAKAA